MTLTMDIALHANVNCRKIKQQNTIANGFRVDANGKQQIMAVAQFLYAARVPAAPAVRNQMLNK